MSTPALIGRTLADRFQITGFIGEGAMAAVYRAVQREEPHDVAVKVMHPQLVSDPTFVKRFQREARAAAQIRHPNTVQIIGFGVDGDILYIAMELVAGKDLFETLVLERRLSEARAARILIQVCDALGEAHDQHIVHRDLKPENIMLVEDRSYPYAERVKVLDFGIAKILERDQSPSSDEVDSMAPSALTTVGTVVGTPAYMSPEQCRGEPVDVRSDVYSCGILLYQLVTGRLPFAGENAMELAVKHVRSPPVPPRQLMPALHPGLEEVILTALSKWPAQRQPHALDLRDDLTKILHELSDRPHDIYTGPGSAPPASLGPEVNQRSRQQSLDGDAVSTLRSELVPEDLHAWVGTDGGSGAIGVAETLPDPRLRERGERGSRPPTEVAVVTTFNKGGPASRPGVAPGHDPARDASSPLRLPEPPSKMNTLPSTYGRSSYIPPSSSLSASPWMASAPLSSARPSSLPQTPAPGARGELGAWLLIPLAIVIGVAAGVLAFILLR
jgi:eukaryotic-like serine/threonine-protein kinase